MWNISLPDFRIQYVILLKGGIHTMYWVKWKMTILFLTYREKCYIFKDYYIYIYMYNIFTFSPLNSVITCNVFVQLIKFIYICFVSNKVLLKVQF